MPLGKPIGKMGALGTVNPEVIESAGLEPRGLRHISSDQGSSPSILIFAFSRICLLGQPVQQGKESRRLADKKSHVGQELDHARGNPVCLGWTNNRADRQVPAKKRTWL